jgi:voltage-gated potassium channel
MAWVGVMFALLVGYQLAVPLSASTTRIVELVGWICWGVFLAEFLAQLWLAPHRRHFLRRHWLQGLILVLPVLRVVSFLRLLRLGRALPAARVISSSYRVSGVAKAVLRSRLAYLAAVSLTAIVALAELAFLFERHTHSKPAFEAFGSTLLWTASVVIGMQGDPVPSSAPGRAVMVLGFAFGAVVIASLAGSLGAYFLDDRRERAETQVTPASRADPVRRPPRVRERSDA